VGQYATRIDENRSNGKREGGEKKTFTYETNRLYINLDPLAIRGKRRRSRRGGIGETGEKRQGESARRKPCGTKDSFR